MGREQGRGQQGAVGQKAAAGSALGGGEVARRHWRGGASALWAEHSHPPAGPLRGGGGARGAEVRSTAGAAAGWGGQGQGPSPPPCWAGQLQPSCAVAAHGAGRLPNAQRQLAAISGAGQQLQGGSIAWGHWHGLLRAWWAEGGGVSARAGGCSASWAEPPCAAQALAGWAGLQGLGAIVPSWAGAGQATGAPLPGRAGRLPCACELRGQAASGDCGEGKVARAGWLGCGRASWAIHCRRAAGGSAWAGGAWGAEEALLTGGIAEGLCGAQQCASAASWAGLRHPSCSAKITLWARQPLRAPPCHSQPSQPIQPRSGDLLLLQQALLQARALRDKVTGLAATAQHWQGALSAANWAEGLCA